MPPTTTNEAQGSSGCDCAYQAAASSTAAPIRRTYFMNGTFIATLQSFKRTLAKEICEQFPRAPA